MSYATPSYGAPNGTPGGQGDQAYVLIMTALVQIMTREPWRCFRARAASARAPPPRTRRFRAHAPLPRTRAASAAHARLPHAHR